MSALLDSIKNKLVVSCQAAPQDPLENVDALRRIALASVTGGAAGLRLNSAECIAAVRPDTNLPIIGIEKAYLNGRLRITPDFASAAALADAGADIIALDCTDRAWPGGEPWRQLVERIRGDLHLPVLADIATLEEALSAAAAGADLIGTTLNGYTEQTRNAKGFNWTLLADAVLQTGLPVVAEGHISNPSEAKRAIMAGAWCVVVGSAITRPGKITAGFVQAIRSTRDSNPAIAVDIGGTSIKAGLVDRTGRIDAPMRVPTQAQGGRDAIAGAAVKVIEQVLLYAQQKNIEPIGLGIASAGVVDSRTGAIFAATENLPGWSGFDLRTFAGNRFQLPTRVENDSHAAALAELYFGSGRPFDSLVAITIGTGLGGGVILNRKLVRGNLGFAGSFGHSTIRPNGRPCSCGRAGCLEAYVSAGALALEYRDRSAADHDPGIDDAALALEVGRRALANEPTAREAYSALADYLAEGVANVFNVFDPEVVILSGGLVENHHEFVAEVERRVARMLHFGALRKPCVRLSSAGHQAGLLGAAAAVFQLQEE
ncbi:MAG: putative N-acetylmannosamine-6-phosphate 2-epimerase [Tepidisphaeraceae bacterium]|jgi:predicted NBD/HSP70 family sugar kinase/putative N-acetylmannosamine-6-phosphate epimerase